MIIADGGAVAVAVVRGGRFDRTTGATVLLTRHRPPVGVCAPH